MSSYQKGFGAYERGNYDTALKEWRPLAKQGLSQAQYNLGLMYAEGEGVAQDYQEAVRWYRLAAEQGHASGQFSLGAMYTAGQGVSKDYVFAHMLWNLAAAKGKKKAVNKRDILEKRMTADQLAEAQRLAREWKPKRK
ncbi:MAG: sel1 repeat family protein [Nitrospinae bacterium]|nr:sel1 repeat family protein [Nitrospinota bacterium]